MNDEIVPHASGWKWKPNPPRQCAVCGVQLTRRNIDLCHRHKMAQVNRNKPGTFRTTDQARAAVVARTTKYRAALAAQEELTALKKRQRRRTPKGATP